MTIVHQLKMDGTEYHVVISDDSQALLAAAAAGSAVVGLWRPGTGQELAMVRYLVERPEDADEAFLKKVIRRTFGLPQPIAVTKRLNIREFQLADIPCVYAETDDSEADRVFYDRDMLAAYIQAQYGFFEYGLWALEERGTGVLMGKAGVVGSIRGAGGAEGLELGYHIFTPYRRRGYALEACQAVIKYTLCEFQPSFLGIKTDASNEASVGLAYKLGFTKQIYTETGTIRYLIAENC